MPLSRRSGWGLFVALLSTTSSAQSPSPSESPPPPVVERRELPPEARQRFEAIFQRVLELKPVYDEATATAQALETRRRAEEARLLKLKAEAEALSRELNAINQRLVAGKRTMDERAPWRDALWQRFTQGDTLSPEERQAFEQHQQFLSSLKADVDRSEATEAKLKQLVAEYEGSIPGYEALRQEMIRAKALSLQAAIRLSGAEVKLGKEGP